MESYHFFFTPGRNGAFGFMNILRLHMISFVFNDVNRDVVSIRKEWVKKTCAKKYTLITIKDKKYISLLALELEYAKKSIQ